MEDRVTPRDPGHKRWPPCGLCVPSNNEVARHEEHFRDPHLRLRRPYLLVTAVNERPSVSLSPSCRTPGSGERESRATAFPGREAVVPGSSALGCEPLHLAGGEIVDGTGRAELPFGDHLLQHLAASGDVLKLEPDVLLHRLGSEVVLVGSLRLRGVDGGTDLLQEGG